MKKSCTITFHAADNYGAFFQAYALQKYITRDCKADNEIINFVSNHMKEHYSVFKKSLALKDIIKNFIISPYSSKLSKRRKRFEADRAKFLNLTEEISEENQYYDLISKYDIGIAGSDQIWNINSEDFTPLFFLPGLKEKIGYAASTGSEIDESQKDEYKNFLESFTKVCIRETGAKKFFDDMKLPSGETEVCIDPTFLISIEDYDVFSNSSPIIEGDYILYYSINNSEESMRMASSYANELGLPIYAIYSRLTSIKAKKYGMKVIYDAGPSEFINLLKNCKCMFTNSFHGTALSIILHKSFMRLGKLENNELVRDERIDSILEIAGLTSQTVTADSKIDVDELLTIDWDKIEANLLSNREYAKSYLKRYLME